MAKRITWSAQARQELLAILDFWYQHNGNKNYSRKLNSKFRETIRHIQENNYLGKATTDKDVRVSVCGNYLLFYQIRTNAVHILSIFDSRRNPENLKLK